MRRRSKESVGSARESKRGEKGSWCVRSVVLVGYGDGMMIGEGVVVMVVVFLRRMIKWKAG